MPLQPAGDGRNAGAYDLSNLSAVSSGVMWSMSEAGVLEYMHNDAGDSFGSPAVGFGSSITTKDAPVSTVTTRFLNVDKTTRNSARMKHPALSPLSLCRLVITKKEKTPNFQNHWRRALPIPGDCLSPKTALTLLGRGSVCINSAGEKYTRKKWKSSLSATAWKTRWLSVCRMKMGSSGDRGCKLSDGIRI